MRCENKQCHRPYQYNTGKLVEFLVRPWTWGFSYIPGQTISEFHWLCEYCQHMFDVRQEQERVCLTARAAVMEQVATPVG